MKKTIIVALSTILLASCSEHRPHPDTSACTVTLQIQPFYRDLFSTTDHNLQDKTTRLSQQYADFFAPYCERELHIGNPADEDFVSNLQRFISYKENNEVIATCDSVFDKYIPAENEKLSQSLSYLKYYLPNTALPQHVYCHFSGFNNKILIDSTYVSISIEHYLGTECRYYPWLEIPLYARKGKKPENISMDITKAILYANYPDLSTKDDVLSAMIYQGKILYLTSLCLPDEPMTTIMGLTDSEMKWCEKAEVQMWGFLAEQKLLYSTNPLDRNKLVNETPFTVFFGDKSPGRATLYCALNIVRSYIDKHPETTMEQLLQMDDAQQLLVDAQYRP